MATTLSPKGRFEIAADEGLVPAPYYDVVNVLTFGVGHTRPAGAPDPATLPKGNPVGEKLRDAMIMSWQIFRKDMAKFTADVVSVLGPDLQQHELDGWVSFHFNTGGIFRTSAIAKWKAGDKVGAMRILKMWNKGTIAGKKQVLSALVNRRQREADLILHGRYSDRKMGVFRVSNNNRPIYSNPFFTFSYSEWEAWLKKNGLLQADSKVPAAAGGAAGGAATVGLLVALWELWDRIEAWIGGLF